jgi:type I restriction-modification system DNA methylase subunit
MQEAFRVSGWVDAEDQPVALNCDAFESALRSLASESDLERFGVRGQAKTVRRQTLDETESQRLNLQGELDQRFVAKERNRRGQFATPPALATDMARVAMEYLEPHCGMRFLDPALGTGVFFTQRRKRWDDGVLPPLSVSKSIPW